MGTVTIAEHESTVTIEAIDIYTHYYFLQEETQIIPEHEEVSDELGN